MVKTTYRSSELLYHIKKLYHQTDYGGEHYGICAGEEGFDAVIGKLLQSYRIFAPVRKKGAGRFTDIDAIIYDEVSCADEIELSEKSDYSAKEFLTPFPEQIRFISETEERKIRSTKEEGIL